MALQHIEDTQSWTALFRAFISHQQPSAYLTKGRLDFCGHTEGSPCIKDSLWLYLIQGSSDFFLVLRSTTSEKLFIPYKPSVIVQAIMVCPIDREVCPSGEYLWLDMLMRAKSSKQRCAPMTQAACGSRVSG